MSITERISDWFDEVVETGQEYQIFKARKALVERGETYDQYVERLAEIKQEPSLRLLFALQADNGIFEPFDEHEWECAYVGMPLRFMM